jgi:hypothetical protein
VHVVPESHRAHKRRGFHGHKTLTAPSLFEGAENFLPHVGSTLESNPNAILPSPPHQRLGSLCRRCLPGGQGGQDSVCLDVFRFAPRQPLEQAFPVR